MITQEQYLKLEAKIRKDLPRLLEPTEGCWLHTKGYDNIKFKIIHRRAKEFIVDDYKGHKPIDYRNSVLDNYFEIIGHDIMLNDVLEWLGKIDFGLMLETDGTLIQKTSYFDGEKKEVSSRIIQRAMFDLSKPYLKDQSNELKEFLFNLIDE